MSQRQRPAKDRYTQILSGIISAHTGRSRIRTHESQNGVHAANRRQNALRMQDAHQTDPLSCFHLFLHLRVSRREEGWVQSSPQALDPLASERCREENEESIGLTPIPLEAVWRAHCDSVSKGGPTRAMTHLSPEKAHPLVKDGPALTVLRVSG